MRGAGQPTGPRNGLCGSGGPFGLGAARVLLVTVGVANACVVAVLAVIVASHPVSHFDRSVLGWFAHLDHFTPIHLVAEIITLMAAAALIYPAAAGVALALWLYGERRLAIILAGAEGLNEAAVVILKHTFHRARPTHGDHLIAYSFPSGHAAAGVAIFGLLAVIALILWPERRRVVLIIAPLLIFGPGLSRLVLSVHWPSDVAAGYALGGCILAFAAALLAGRAGGRQS